MPLSPTQEQQRWDACKINPDKQAAFNSVAARLTASKARYQAVSTKTGVPWWFIAVVHERESSQRWDRSLAQGDPWNKKSVHVPAGRGPFNSWEEAAVDSLTNCAPYAARNKDWSMGNALAMLVKYNGLGYSRKGLPSPYVWAGTNQYVKGKYVADGVYDPNHTDTQLGCAGLLKVMLKSNTASSGSAGAVVAAGAAAAVSAPSHYLPYIIGGTAALAVIAWIVFRVYEHKKANNV